MTGDSQDGYARQARAAVGEFSAMLQPNSSSSRNGACGDDLLPLIKCVPMMEIWCGVGFLHPDAQLLIDRR